MQHCCSRLGWLHVKCDQLHPYNNASLCYNCKHSRSVEEAKKYLASLCRAANNHQGTTMVQEVYKAIRDCAWRSSPWRCKDPHRLYDFGRLLWNSKTKWKESNHWIVWEHTWQTTDIRHCNILKLDTAINETVHALQKKEKPYPASNQDHGRKYIAIVRRLAKQIVNRKQELRMPV